MEIIYKIHNKKFAFDDMYNQLNYMSDKTGLLVGELLELKYETFMKLLDRELEREFIHRTELESYIDKREGQVNLADYTLKI